MSADQPRLLPEREGEPFDETMARYVAAASRLLEEAGPDLGPNLLRLIADLETLTEAQEELRAPATESTSPQTPLLDAGQADSSAEPVPMPTPRPVIVPKSIDEGEVRSALARWTASRPDLPEGWSDATDFTFLDQTWWQVEVRWMTGTSTIVQADGPGPLPPAHLRPAPDDLTLERYRPTAVEDARLEFLVPGSHSAMACTACSGTGSTQCGQCNGHGELVCGYCEGSKIVTCPTTVRCTECGGDGRVRSRSKSNPGGTVSCRACQGDGQRSCPDCRGRGQRPCSSCHQRGRVRCDRCDGVGAVRCSQCDGTRTVSTWLEDHLTWISHRESVATPAAGRELGEPVVGEGTLWISPHSDPELNTFLAPQEGELLREVTVTAHPLAQLSYEGPRDPEVLWVGGVDGAVEAPAIEDRKAAADRHRRRVRISVALVALAVIAVAAAVGWTLLG